MPSFISLASEYAPRRLRATLVAILWAGFPLGGAVGGFLASRMLPAYGWESLFYVGGVLPLVLAVLLYFALPESVGFLVDSGAPGSRVAGALRRVLPGMTFADDARFVLNEQHEAGAPIKHLFDHGRATGTVLLWVSYFVAFMMLVTNS